MYTAKIENKNGAVYVLTGNEPVYQVIDITGLNPPPAQINTTPIVGLDGALFNSSRLDTRNIVLTIKINGDVEKNRLALYQAFRTKEWCRFYYTNGTLDVYIDGYVETVECGLFTNDEQAQISILCPSPYFRSLEEIIDDISSVTAKFTFPFDINVNQPIPISEFRIADTTNVINSSSAETGMIIEIDVLASIYDIEIRNVITGDRFMLGGNYQAGDKIIIDTNKGQKSVKLVRDGITTNILSKIARGSVFFQLQPGDNFFGFLIDLGDNNQNVYITIKHFNAYRGV